MIDNYVMILYQKSAKGQQMTRKTLNVFGKTILFSLIASTFASAGTQEHNQKANDLPRDYTDMVTTYQSMSTAQLQEEVERHIKKGDLSFIMGEELIKRWTKR